MKPTRSAAKMAVGLVHTSASHQGLISASFLPHFCQNRNLGHFYLTLDKLHSCMKKTIQQFRSNRVCRNAAAHGEQVVSGFFSGLGCSPEASCLCSTMLNTLLHLSSAPWRLSAPQQRCFSAARQVPDLLRCERLRTKKPVRQKC